MLRNSWRNPADCRRIANSKLCAWSAMSSHFKQHIGLKYAELAYYGLWFTPLREALDAFVESTQRDMTGTVTLALYKGNVSVVSRQSENSLVSHRSFVLHHGRQLRPERCGRIHPHSGSAFALAGADSSGEIRSGEDRGFDDEDVVGTLPPAARCRSSSAGSGRSSSTGACCVRNWRPAAPMRVR